LNNILVEACVITYNQADYIIECLNSILEQNLNSEFRIIVFDDCSTDRTSELLDHYSNENNIKMVINEQNLGVSKNFKKCVNQSTAKYVAICEGDDFWNDQLKIQKQLDALENNPDCSFCFTDVNTHENNKITGIHPNFGKAKQKFSGIDLADHPGSIAQTCSLVIRRKFLEDIPEWVLKSSTLDWCLQLYLSKYGPAIYLPETTATYRIHDQGIWSKLNEFDAWRKNLCFYRTALGQFSLTDHKKRLRKRIITTIKDALELANVTADKKEIRYWLKERLAVSPVDRFRQTIQSLLLLAKLRKAT
jgi:glycosyltransferase involved in cell wall biosynthesis